MLCARHVQRVKRCPWYDLRLRLDSRKLSAECIEEVAVFCKDFSLLGATETKTVDCGYSLMAPARIETLIEVSAETMFRIQTGTKGGGEVSYEDCSRGASTSRSI